MELLLNSLFLVTLMSLVIFDLYVVCMIERPRKVNMTQLVTNYLASSRESFQTLNDTFKLFLPLFYTSKNAYFRITASLQSLTAPCSELALRNCLKPGHGLYGEMKTFETEHSIVILYVIMHVYVEVFKGLQESLSIFGSSNSLALTKYKETLQFDALSTKFNESHTSYECLLRSIKEIKRILHPLSRSLISKSYLK
jgi:hypothetical protein